MFIKIYFILVCYLTVSTNSTEPNSNLDPVVSDSDKKFSTTIKPIDSKIPIQPSLGISATNNNIYISSTLTQKGLNTAKTNQFSLTSIRKEPLTISTTGETVKQSQISDHSKKSNSQNQEYSKKTNKKTTSVNPNKIEDNRDPEGSKITKPHNNIHSVYSENPNKPENNPISGDNSESSRVTKLDIIHSKKSDSPNNSDTETLEDSRKTKHNKTTLRMSVITEKSQTEDQDNSIKTKPSRKAESTDSDNLEKSITNKKTEQSKLEKTKTFESEKLNEPSANGQEKFSENLMGNKQKNHVTKIINTKNRNFDDALSLKKIKSQDLDESNDNSSSHFMIFIFIGLLFTIVAYVAFQKRKKIMAYVIEGRRRTSRSRRVSGGKDTKVSYKPLETEDKEAGTTNYKYVY